MSLKFKKDKMEILSKRFYSRDPVTVAKELLGKILVRKFHKSILSGKIVETEAYYGEKDPTSRAYTGKKYFNKIMWDEPGKAFIYMVHGNWLFNIKTLPKGKASAVLIRALEPLEGVEIMKRNRRVNELKNLTNGPGKLTQALKITNEFNGLDLTRRDSVILIIKRKKEKFEIEKSFRIGVSKDLPIPLRFYIKDNPFVSRK